MPDGEVEDYQEEIIKTYGRSEKGNFGAVDTIAVTHPYCVTPAHLQHSTGMYLNIPEAEEKGARCGTCRGVLKDHETALLIECLKEPTNDNEYGKELHKYIKLCIQKTHFKKRGFAGCAFLDKFGTH